MTSEDNTHEFAMERIAAWSAHDLDGTMSHCDDNVGYFSTSAVKLAGNQSGIIQGKKQVKEYLSKGLTTYSVLNFTLCMVFVGAASIAIQCKSVNNCLEQNRYDLA